MSAFPSNRRAAWLNHGKPTGVTARKTRPLASDSRSVALRGAISSRSSIEQLLASTDPLQITPLRAFGRAASRGKLHAATTYIRGFTLERAAAALELV
jgi:hypothetical protein